MKEKLPYILSFLIVAAVVGLAAVAGRHAAVGTPYTPIILVWERGDPIWADAPELLTSQHSAAFEQIALGYGFQVRRDGDGTLYLLGSLASDREMIGNLTSKAIDAEACAATQPDAPR